MNKCSYAVFHTHLQLNTHSRNHASGGSCNARQNMYRMTLAWQTMISNSCLGCGANVLRVSDEDVATAFVSVSSDPDGVAATSSVAEDGTSAR